MNARASKSGEVNRWVMGVVGSILGFALSQWIAAYQFSKNLASTKEIEMIHLARDLAKEFYSDKDSDPIYRQMRDTIDGCGKLYDQDGGEFNYDEVNRYLGFFDDIGFYYKRKAVDLDTVMQVLGDHIIEAYETPELQKYMAALQKNSEEPTAFVNFQALAKDLANTTDGSALAKSFPIKCGVVWAKKSKESK